MPKNQEPSAISLLSNNSAQDVVQEVLAKKSPSDKNKKWENIDEEVHLWQL